MAQIPPCVQAGTEATLAYLPIAAGSEIGRWHGSSHTSHPYRLPVAPFLLSLQDQELESLAAIEAELERVAHKLHELRRG